MFGSKEMIRWCNEKRTVILLVVVLLVITSIVYYFSAKDIQPRIAYGGWGPLD